MLDHPSRSCRSLGKRTDGQAHGSPASAHRGARRSGRRRRRAGPGSSPTRSEVIVLSEWCLQRLLTSSVALYRRWSTHLARAMAWPEFRPSLLLIRGACARHDGRPGPPSGTSFANAPHSAGDCQTSLSPRARGPHAFLSLRWGGAEEAESRGKRTGAPHCISVPDVGWSEVVTICQTSRVR
jgi:hypothetical protein